MRHVKRRRGYAVFEEMMGLFSMIVLCVLALSCGACYWFRQDVGTWLLRTFVF